jgi:GntR family transcriptional regulator
LIGAASPGDALPTEAALCARFNVSRMTVRQAVQELSVAGLVDRQRGRGTFVAARPMHRRPGVFLSFTEEMARRGMTATSRMVSAGIDSARPEELADLRLAEGADVVRVERVRLADGVPIAFEDAAVLIDHRAVLDSNLEFNSLHGELGRLGVVATSATGTVTARLVSRAESRLLGVAPRTALLVELRLLFDQHGRPFERTESRYVADRYVIDVVHASPR